jgi:hypothetical protein
MDANLPPFVDKVIKNRSTINIVSIVMLLIAAWACLEILTNLSGSDLIPPETGTVKDANDQDGQRLNDGKVLFVGAVFGTLGVVFQLMIAGLSPTEEEVVVVEEVDEDIEEAVEMDSQDVESDSEEDVEEDSAEDDAPQEEEGVAEDDANESEEEAKGEGDTPASAGRKF